MSDQFVSARVTVLDQLGIVNASQTVQRNTDLQVVLVADLEEAFHSYFRPEVAKRFCRPIPLIERIGGRRGLEGASLRRFGPIACFKGDAEPTRNAGVVRPFQTR